MRASGRDIPLAIPVFAIYALAGLYFEPRFLSAANLTSILFSATILLPAVIGMQLLLILGKFDLSTGATASLAAMVSGMFLLGHPSSQTLAVGLGLSVGATMGLAIGTVVSRVGIDPLIATLAAMGMARSLSLVINDGRIVAGLPDSFGWVVAATLGGVPVLILLGGAGTGIMALLTSHLVVFRRFYAAGANPVAAAHAGLNVKVLVALGYVLAGIGAAGTGLLQQSRTLSASPLGFDTLAIEAITAAMIGGATLSGGRGGIWGAAAGMVVVTATTNLVTMLGISVYWKDFAVGALLVFAVTIGPCKALIADLRKSIVRTRR